MAAVMAGALSGCGGDSFKVAGSGGAPAPVSLSGVPFQGRVMGAGRPVANAQLQLFAAGTAGSGGGGMALLAAPLTTAADGSFSVVAGSYVCANAETQVLAVARGGAVVPAGASTTTGSNGTLAEVAALGTCGSVVSGSNIVLSEATTVAAAWGLAAFLTSTLR